MTTYDRKYLDVVVADLNMDRPIALVKQISERAIELAITTAIEFGRSAQVDIGRVQMGIDALECSIKRLKVSLACIEETAEEAAR